MKTYSIRLLVLVASIAFTYIALALIVSLIGWENPITVMSSENFIPFRVFGTIMSIIAGSMNFAEMMDKEIIK